MVNFKGLKDKVSKLEMDDGKTQGDFIVDPPQAEEDNQGTDNMKNGVFTIPIKGEIGWDVTSESIIEQMEKADGKDIVFEVASPGGSVFEGIEIFNAIRDHPGDTTAKLVGMAASMASYIPLACNEILAEDNAVYMIHNVWSMMGGDSEDLKKESENLESLNKLLATAYVNQTGKKEKEILQMMDDETWLYGSEIKKEGFVDKMIDHGKEDTNASANKDSKLNDAKSRVKDVLMKLQKELNKLDLDKLSKKNTGGVSKMSNDKPNYVSKFGDANVEAAKAVLDKLNELSKSETVKGEEIKKLAQELEGALIAKQVAAPPAGKVDPPTDVDKDKTPPPEDDKDKDKKDEGAEAGKEADKADPPKDTDADKDKDKADPPADADKDAPPEGEDADKDKADPPTDEASKQSEDIGKAYKKVADEATSKLTELNNLYKVEQDKNEALTKQNLKLKEQVSKFEEDSHNKLVTEVVDEIAKFKELDDIQKKTKTDEISKMSNEALGVMKAEFKGMNVSKLDDEIPGTEPSQNLSGESEPDSVSKMEKQSQDAEIKAAIRRNLGNK